MVRVQGLGAADAADAWSGWIVSFRSLDCQPNPVESRAALDS